MKDDISTALLAFYGKILEPEFRSIKEKLNEHDDKFNRLFDHIDARLSTPRKVGRGIPFDSPRDRKAGRSMEKLEGRMER